MPIDDVYVVGWGMTPFGRHVDPGVVLGALALGGAITSAELERRDIDALYVGHVYGGMVAGERVGALAGLAGIPTLNIENACASGSSAVIEAAYAIAGGRYDVVAVCGFDKLSQSTDMIAPADDDYEGQLGLVFPAWHAMRARLYMHEYGVSRDDLSAVAVKNRAHGIQNPLAQFSEPLTVEDVSSAREIASPLRLLDCCPRGDGAAAVVLAGKDHVAAARRRFGSVVQLVGAGLTSGGPDGTYSPLFEDITMRSTDAAFAGLAVTRDDVRFAEIHDCFSIAEPFRVEGLGLCEQGAYFDHLRDGRWDLGGDLTINPSGGLLSKGHPLGATGVAQICEVATQFAGRAGGRQITGADVALTHTRGGSVPGTEGGSCAVIVCTAV
jgi:acetyl-CoA acetyltransferase